MSDLTLPLSQPRRRGAPRGNLNAIKHGFYSRVYRQSERVDLADAPTSTDLHEEIGLLRVFIRRVLELGKSSRTLPEVVGLLGALSMATSSLSRLVRTQALLSTGNAEVNAALHQALEEVLAEFEQQSTASPGPIVSN